MLSLGSKLLLWKSRYIQRETKRSAQGVSHRGGADVSFLPVSECFRRLLDSSISIWEDCGRFARKCECGGE